jgi:amidophosphoribosyltransferase
VSGIFGVVSRKDCVEDLFHGTDYHSHLGTQFAGLAVLGKSIVRRIHDISSSQFKTKFSRDYKKMQGRKGIGVISAKDEQPIVINSRFGPFAIVTNGLVGNADELAAELFGKGYSFSEVTDGSINFTELVAKLIICGKSIVDGIDYAFSRIKGSCSLLLLNKDGVYAARDRHGHSPLIIGRKAGSWAVAAETTAFHNLGYAVVKEIRPGEIMLLDESGLKCQRRGNGCMKVCSFLWVYTGFPSSSYEGRNVELVREACGRCLARGDAVQPDMVAGIPDSGTAHAIGYAIESGVPFRRPLVKYTPGFDRSYTPVTQQMRDLIARLKLVPIRDIIKGKKIVFCDDSIVRGTQLRNTIKKLKECGIIGIHFRIACPPLMFPCKFNYSTRALTELAARRAIRVIEGRDIRDISQYLDESSPKYRKMVALIAKSLGVTSLKYQKLKDLVSAIGLPEEQLCLYCWTGKES